jgi:hypothetical protein
MSDRESERSILLILPLLCEVDRPIRSRDNDKTDILTSYLCGLYTEYVFMNYIGNMSQNGQPFLI